MAASHDRDKHGFKMKVQPTGTVTFLFSDIEGSTRKWERQPEAMRVALAKHDELLRRSFETEGGHVFKTIGDAFCVAFATAHGALAGAIRAQQALRTVEWGEAGDMKVRMALHAGTAEHRDGDYFGRPLNRVARLLAMAHGGQVLLSLSAQELVRDRLPEGATLKALGEHRLRDLVSPEPLFQLSVSGLPSQFPALRSAEITPNNLPERFNSFIGREREMTKVARLLSECRLVTLTGTGGTGKTRLSLKVATELLDRFRDGVWFVEFAAINDASLAVETVAAALDVRQESTQPIEAPLVEYLRGRQCLIIFDNCEHIVSACARLAEMLLRSCHRIRILASSREPLNIAGETVWPLAPLSLPEHWQEIAAAPDALARLSRLEAVRLFIERAKQVRPAFDATPANIPDIAQICWRLDGIPLAIELAAARIRVLTPLQIVQRLDDRFQLLTNGGRTTSPRQQTLRSLIDWSHDLLNEKERILFRRLSVFERGSSLRSIEAVCSCPLIQESEILDLVTQLADKSLLQVEHGGRLETRHFMLESIRDYALEKLRSANEENAFRGRHLDHFVDLAEVTEPLLRGALQKHHLEVLETEVLNFHLAIQHSLELPGQASKGLRIAIATQRLVEVRGLFKRAREQFGQILAHPNAAVQDATRARALAAAGRLAWVADDMTATARLHSEALEIFRRLGDFECIANTLTDLALHALYDNRQGQAQRLLEEAAALALPRDNPRLKAHIQRVRGILAAVLGDFTSARALDLESLSLYRQLEDTWFVVILCWSVGVNAAALGRFEEAHAHLCECLLVGLELGNRWGASYPLDALAFLALAERRYDRAARLFGAAEANRTRMGLVPDIADHPALRAIQASAPDFSGPEIEAARIEGRSWDLDSAIAVATASRS